MATNYIKIEVDYADAVARVGKLELSFKELANSATKSRKAIQQAIRDTNSVLAGSVKSLQRERAALIETQSTLARNNDEYKKFQRQIDMVDKQIARMTDTRKKEEIVLKNSVEGIRQQIAALKQEQANRKLANSTYRKAQQEIERLEQKLRQLTDTRRQDQIALEGSAAALRKEIAVMKEAQANRATENQAYRETQKEIDKLQAKLNELTDTRQEHEIVQQGSVAYYEQEINIRMQALRNMNLEAEAIERLEQEIVSLNARKAEAAARSQTLNKAMAGTSSSAGAAGATVTEFGRTIGDAPFGLMGMANNLQQLSQQFVDLQTKSGGTKNAIQSILTTMAGPAGFVVAINIVTSALVAYNMRKDKAKQKTEEFNESLLLEKNTLEALNALYKQGADNLEDRATVMGALAAADDKYAEALDKLGVDEEARNALTEEYLKNRNALNVAEDKRNKLAEDNKDLLATELLTEAERAKLLSDIADLEDSMGENARQQLIEKKNRLKQDDNLIDINKQLAESTIEVSDAEKALNETLGQSDFDKFIEKEKDFIKEREKTLALLGLEGVEAIEKEIEILGKDYDAALEKYGVNSIQAAEAKLALDEKKLELQVAQAEKADELAKEEADRVKELAELNQEYIDNLEAQGDDLGIIRLNQAERDAIAEAKALGAGHDVILRITQDFANQRQEILDKDAEKRAEKAKKEAEKQAKEEKKIKEEALKENLRLIGEHFDKEVEMMKERTDKISEILSGFSTIMDEIGNMSQSRFERQIGMLNEERDLVKVNNDLTKEEKNAQLTEIRRRENALHEERIKAEYRTFAVKQTFSVAEMIMKERSAFRERQLMQQKFIEEQRMRAISKIQAAEDAGTMTALQAQTAIAGVNLKAAENLAGANMSIGTFMAQLGPLGIVAFGATIVGVIASIMAAKKKANAEIAGLSNAPIGSAGSVSATPNVPDFNVVGESELNQLGQAITGAQQQPVKAYVVASDVSTAQELDRKILEGASI